MINVSLINTFLVAKFEGNILSRIIVFHSLLVMLQATILNVAINSSNRALLVIMMSNNVSVLHY